MSKTKIQIGLELSCLTGKFPTGIARYSKELYKALSKESAFEVKGLFPLNRALKINNISKNFEGKPHFYWKNINSLDLIHSTDLKKISTKKPLVSTIHDLFLFTPEGERFAEKSFIEKKRGELLETLRRTDHVITISETSKKEIISLFDFDEKKITAVPLGISSDLLSSERKKRNKNQKPYFLFVGAISDRKNVAGLIGAYLNSGLTKDYDLVLAGHMSTGSDEILKMVNKKEIGQKIKFKNHVSDQELIELYDGCIGLSFPTFYEGFGIPPLEAMLRKKPVLVGNQGATTEILKGRALFCNPYEEESIREGLKKLLTIKQDQIDLNYNFAKSFTWAETAKRTASVYKNLV